MTGSSDGGPTHAESRLRTARVQLSKGLRGAALEETAPDPPLEELAGVAAFGAVVTGHDLLLSVYVLDGWGRGRDHAGWLRARATARHRVARVAVNGELLLVATVAADPTPADRILLNDLCAAFAGRE